MERQRGDTIIEVMFAIAIFAFVAISSMAIMNQGIATGERALEITLVRQQINAQAEALRFVHASKVAGSAHSSTWDRFKSDEANSLKQSAASPFGLEAGEECKLPEGRPFVLNPRTAEVWSGVLSINSGAAANAPPFPQVIYNDSNKEVKDDPSIRTAYGLWVEAVPSGSGATHRFIDFHIRACWPAPGSPVPMTIGTIVRLYDPA